MRRALPICAVLATLAAASTAAAALQKVPHDRVPLLRRGALPLLPASAGRVTVVVGMSLPPLAQANRSLAAVGAARRLDASSTASRLYLARLARAQAAAVAELRRAIPEARVGYRFRIVLDGFAVTLPARRLPALARMSFARTLYPSVRYRAATDRSPAMIGAPQLAQATGADGRGMKIAVVDTGIDPKSPYLRPADYSYPAGFPKGDRKYTTAKVIVAKVFPGPNAGPRGKLPLDVGEPHGTHVAGIAAGNAGTRAPAGPDHPAVSGLSGVAPRAWLGNYRVFTVPTPIGHVADTPQIVAAFEAAVADGMDVINFSGGGAETDPANDALVEAVRNVAAAGVVPVIAAGNDRDDYGLGTTGTPGTAPDAISVAAVSNTHVFAPAARVTAAGAPAELQRIPVMRGAGGELPTRWARADQTVVDVGSVGDPYACGPPSDPNGPGRPLPTGSLARAVALVSRGRCSFAGKVARARAAGAIGAILVDNRSGEANPIPEEESLPTAMISDLDGARLRAFMAAHGGRTTMRFGTKVEEIDTGRGGTITSFSSAGPTAFGHRLKPDLAAPGGQVLSSTPPATTGSTFSVFDGTSMATPHVAGAAALLLERHPQWTPQQVKSALVETAGPAWADTARTAEASVLLEGGGLVSLTAADDPRVFTDPVSLSFGDLRPGGTRSLLLSLADAGGGAGTWQVELQPQSATSGATLTPPPAIEVAPGGTTSAAITVAASPDAPNGWDYGFLVLRQGTVVRRVPYAFLVERPALAGVAAIPLRKRQTGDTRRGRSRVAVYCCPLAPFGPPAAYTGPTMNEAGAEHLYVTHVNAPVANAGVSILSSSRGSIVDPWWLGAKDETSVQGYTGTPVNVNDLMPDVHEDVHAAGTVFPRQQEFFVSVDSGADRFTGRSKPGRYVLNWWVNDVTPPALALVTPRVPAGRPLLVARVTDRQSGVDPFSLVLAYHGVQLAADEYDPQTGLALFPLPPLAPRIAAGATRVTVGASDFQETKNVDTFGPSIMPNTRRKRFVVAAVERPVVTWLGCRTLVAQSTVPVRSLRVPGTRVTRLRTGIYRIAAAHHGRLRATAVDTRGRRASSTSQACK